MPIEHLLLISVIFFMEKLIIIIFMLTLTQISDTEEVCPPHYREITASNDSLKHWYIEPVEGENWCWKHNMYENLRIVNPKIEKEKETLSLNQ
tara:strand:- start:2202 stop:2480 length:279 start_codon:yes stop_codon:yes gene_type:complete